MTLNDLFTLVYNGDGTQLLVACRVQFLKGNQEKVPDERPPGHIPDKALLGPFNNYPGPLTFNPGFIKSIPTFIGGFGYISWKLGRQAWLGR
jgi:hypothetical protein